jgi:hypothetical protein
MRHGFNAAAVLDVGADGVATARIADQHDLLCAGGLEHSRHLGSQRAHLVFGRAAVWLWLGVVVARGRVGHVDRHQAITRPAVALEAP